MSLAGNKVEVLRQQQPRIIADSPPNRDAMAALVPPTKSPFRLHNRFVPPFLSKGWDDKRQQKKGLGLEISRLISKGRTPAPVWPRQDLLTILSRRWLTTSTTWRKSSSGLWDPGKVRTDKDGGVNQPNGLACLHMVESVHTGNARCLVNTGLWHTVIV